MRRIAVLLLSVAALQAALAAEPVTRIVTQGDVRAKVDLAQQVLKIEVGTLPETYDGPPGHLGTSFSGFTPSSVLIAKAKAFDDGLIAAVELAAFDGLGELPGRVPFIRDVERHLGGKKGTPARVGKLIRDALNAAETRNRDAAYGVYTWTPELRRAFRVRRVLQSTLDADDAVFVKDLIAADPSLSLNYDRLTRWDARLFNRPERPPVTHAVPGTAAYAIFPGGRSPEVEIAEERYGSNKPPLEFDPLDVLVDEIRAGKRSLEPRPDSGWYDWIGWAHEPLLTFDRCPERKKIEPNDNYRALLVEQFRGAYVQTRESFAGGVPGGVLGGALGRRSIHIRPDLTIEPLPEYYGRRARAYDYIVGVLQDAFGDEGMKQLRRMHPGGGRSAQPLPDELATIAAIFRGASALASREIGLAAPDAAGEREIATFESWRRGLSDDPDVGRDARAMVPVFYDAFRNKTKVWMFLGWYGTSATIDFGKRPAITVLPDDPQRAYQQAAKPNGEFNEFVDVYFDPQHVTLYRPVVASAYVDKVLDRDAFRALCAKYPTTDALLAHLNGGSTSK